MSAAAVRSFCFRQTEVHAIANATHSSRVAKGRVKDPWRCNPLIALSISPEQLVRDVEQQAVHPDVPVGPDKK